MSVTCSNYCNDKVENIFLFLLTDLMKRHQQCISLFWYTDQHIFILKQLNRLIASDKKNTRLGLTRYN